MSKATDFQHKVQCSKTSIVYSQARDPNCHLHLTHTVVDVSTFSQECLSELNKSVLTVAYAKICFSHKRELSWVASSDLMCQGQRYCSSQVMRWQLCLQGAALTLHERQEAGDMARMGSLPDLPLPEMEKPSLEGPCRFLTFLLIYSTLLPLNQGLCPNSLKLIDPQLMPIQLLLLPMRVEDGAVPVEGSTCIVDEIRGQTKHCWVRAEPSRPA